MRRALTVSRSLDFLAFADILDVLGNCNLLEHIQGIAGYRPPSNLPLNSEQSQTPERTRDV